MPAVVPGPRNVPSGSSVRAQAEQERVVHQVAADLVAGVGRARHQQELGVLDRVGGQHVATRGDRVLHGGRERVAGPPEVLDAGDLVVGADEHLAGHGLRDHPGAGGHGEPRSVFSALYLACDRAAGDAARVALAPQPGGGPPDRADRLVAPAPVVRRVGRGVAPAGHRHHAGRVGVLADPHRTSVEVLGHPPVEVGRRDLVHRVDVARAGTVVPVRSWSSTSAATPISRSASAYHGEQLVVAERPVHAHAVRRSHLEVVGQHPDAMGVPVQGRATAAAEVVAAERLRALLDEVPRGARRAAGGERADVEHAGGRCSRRCRPSRRWGPSWARRASR